MEKKIELSLTLYAFSWEYATGRYSLEGLLKKARDMGYKGIEMVASQMMPEYPFPSEEWMDDFAALLKKYELEPVCYSAYIDMGIHSDRDLTEQEIIQHTLNDMIYAKRMGFRIVRTQHAISPAIFERMLPYAKKLDIILAIEMHAPHTPEVPVWKKLLAVMDRGEGYLGVVPDFSIFAETPHRFHIEQGIEEFGCRREKLDDIVRLHRRGEPMQALLAGDYSEGEKRFIEDVYATYGSGGANLAWLDVLLPHTVYVHGKFWYIGEDEIDPTVPCEAILPLIKGKGFTGYIASEYEGHHFSPETDTEQQLARWVRMTSRILDKA